MQDEGRKQFLYTFIKIFSLKISPRHKLVKKIFFSTQTPIPRMKFFSNQWKNFFRPQVSANVKLRTNGYFTPYRKKKEKMLKNAIFYIEKKFELQIGCRDVAETF